jgi:hypothetical protein
VKNSHVPVEDWLRFVDELLEKKKADSVRVG